MPTRPPIHRPPGAVAVHRQSDRHRNRQAHRKLYGLACYRRFREAMRRERPLCEDCLEATPRRLAPSEDCHHKRRLAEHPEDLCDGKQVRMLCSQCHDIRTGKGE